VRTLRISAVQLAAHDRRAFSGRWPSIVERMRGAAAGGGLVVLPEGTIPAYVLGREPIDDAEIAAAVADCRSAARDTGAVIVIGCARRAEDRLFNGALVIDADGSIAGWAHKQFLWHFDRQWFAAGEELHPIDTAAGRLGVLVCADGRIPTIAGTLVDRGAEVLVMPTAWVTSGRDPAHLENVQADLLARIRARENGVPFVAANKCGVELGCVAYCGKSQIIAADGTVVATGSQDVETTLAAELLLAEPRPYRSQQISGGDPAPHLPRRIAITARPGKREDERILEILEAGTFIAAGEIRIGALCPVLNDDQVFDPGVLAGMRRIANHDFVVWKASCDPQWQTAFARSRAIELRIYLCVFDAARSRAYAIDPDGTILCGTFDGYEVAVFAYDPARTAVTAVAPGSDVLEGLRRAADAAR
jgi:predicted amidohydrolase